MLAISFFRLPSIGTIIVDTVFASEGGYEWRDARHFGSGGKGAAEEEDGGERNDEVGSGDASRPIDRVGPRPPPGPPPGSESRGPSPTHRGTKAANGVTTTLEADAVKEESYSPTAAALEALTKRANSVHDADYSDGDFMSKNPSIFLWANYFEENDLVIPTSHDWTARLRERGKPNLLS